MKYAICLIAVLLAACQQDTNVSQAADPSPTDPNVICNKVREHTVKCFYINPDNSISKIN